MAGLAAAQAVLSTHHVWISSEAKGWTINYQHQLGESRADAEE